MTLYWDSPTENGSPIESYHLEILPKDGSVLGSSLSLPPHCRQYLIENLVPSKTYSIRIQAANDVGFGEFSTSIEATTMSPPPPAPKIELVQATYNSLKLKWHLDESISDETMIYTLEMENKTGTFSPLVNELTTRTYKVIRLCESTSYRFRIRASSVSTGVGQWSDIFAFSTLRAPPVALKYAPQINNITENACDIDWQPIKSNGALNSMEKIYYNLQIRTVSNLSTVCTHEAFETVYKGPRTNYRLTTLVPGSAYKIRVINVRISECGQEVESAPSPVASFSTIETSVQSSTTDVNNDNAFGTKVISDGFNFLCGGDQQFSDRHWAMLILVAFSILALLVAFILQRFIPDEMAMTEGDSSIDPLSANGAP